MVAKLNITGERYGRLVARSRAEKRGRRSYWLFDCDCGTSKEIRLESVRSGAIKSCGCLCRETTRNRSITHGQQVNRTTTPTLKAWKNAKGRCYNPRDPKYPNYGGRGIRMCESWKNDFSAFLRDMGEKPEGRTLDRVDVNGNYEPRNCRWATYAQQARTRTDNILVQHNGSMMILKDYAREQGVSYKSLHARVKYKGQTPQEAAHAMRSHGDHS